ncbi:MAG: Na+/H+ antiporter NhaA [Candidatus Phosphoribacter baldrii]
MAARFITSARRLLRRPSDWEARQLADALRTETIGGMLLLSGAVLALAWANSPWHTAYTTMRDTRVGPAAPLHLDLTLGHWAADGLLALFFLVAGIELKREFVAGDLSDRTKAIVPIAAAVAGVALPALLYAVSILALGADTDALRGWAIPTATDIAFALAVLAVIGSHLPTALRAFLLTLAVVDDLIAITIIAVFFSADVAVIPLAAAGLPVAVWWGLLRRGWTHPLLLAVPAVATWVLIHESGVHATVAGILLGLTVPVRRSAAPALPEGGHSLAERIEHGLRPWSAGFAVPIFAFFAAGVRVVDGGLTAALTDPVTVGIVVGLIVGKALGVLGGTWLVARFTRAELDDGLAWADVAGLALLSGLGFTVSLLIGELAFGASTARDDHVKVAVLVGSLGAAILAAIVLRRRNAHYRRLEEQEADGIPER